MKKKGLIQLENLMQVSRGDKAHMKVYLLQFSHLIPKRTGILMQALKDQDRKKVRQILHKMSPQLQFFSVPGILPIIRQVENDYEHIAFPELESLCRQFLLKLNAVKKELKVILAELEA